MSETSKTYNILKDKFISLTFIAGIKYGMLLFNLYELGLQMRKIPAWCHEHCHRDLFHTDNIFGGNMVS